MKSQQKSKLRKVTAMLIALAMFVTLSIPAAGAQYASAMTDKTQAAATTADEPEVQSQQQSAVKQEMKKADAKAAKSAEKKVNKQPIGISIKQKPADTNIYLNSKGEPHCLFSGLKVEIQYDDDSKEPVVFDDDWGNKIETEYQPEGTICYISAVVPNNVKLGANTVNVIYTMNDKEGTSLKNFTKTFIMTGKTLGAVDSLKVKTPKGVYAYAGLENIIVKNGTLSVKVNYKGGPSETIYYGDGHFASLYFDPDASLRLVPSKIKEGNNTVTIEYGREQANTTGEFTREKSTSFIVQGKRAKLPTGIEIKKAPDDPTIYVGEDGNCTYNSKGMEAEIKYSDNSSEIVKFSSGPYYRTKTQLKGTDCYVRASLPNNSGEFHKGETVQLKVVYTMEDTYSQGNNVLRRYEKPVELTVADPPAVTELKVQNEKQIYAYAGLKQVIAKDGMAVKVSYGNGDSEVLEYEDGSFGTSKYDRAVVQLSVSEPIKVGTNTVQVKYGQVNDESDFTKIEKETTFTVQGEKIKIPTNISIAQQPEDKDVYIDTRGNTSYNLKGMKIKIQYDHGASEIVETEEYGYGTPVYRPKGIDCQICTNPPEELKLGSTELTVRYTMEANDAETGELLEPLETSLFLNGKKTEQIYGLTILPDSVAPQKYNGKAKKPAITVKDGTRLLKKDIDYAVTYSDNINAGTSAKVIITGKRGYAGTVTKTFTIAKASQAISGATSFKKTYGTSTFNLGAHAKTKLTYKSSNTKVVTVSSIGKLSLKGPGKATIAIKATASQNYNAASKNVVITVNPKKMATPGAKSIKSKTLKATWKKDSKVSGYQVIIAKNSKFTRENKTATITRNKTASKIFTKLSKKKTYYVKVRAYKKVGSQKLYGSYSKVKRVRVK